MLDKFKTKKKRKKIAPSLTGHLAVSVYRYNCFFSHVFLIEVSEIAYLYDFVVEILGIVAVFHE